MTDEHGPIAADVVVNAGGIYANQIGRMAGVEVPIVPFAHQYLITKPVEGGSVDLPTMRDPDRLVYFRGEAGGGLVMGGYEREPGAVGGAGRTVPPTSTTSCCPTIGSGSSRSPRTRSGWCPR